MSTPGSAYAKQASQGEPARAQTSMGRNKGCKLHGTVHAGALCSDALWGIFGPSHKHPQTILITRNRADKDG